MLLKGKNQIAFRIRSDIREKLRKFLNEQSITATSFYEVLTRGFLEGRIVFGVNELDACEAIMAHTEKKRTGKISKVQWKKGKLPVLEENIIK